MDESELFTIILVFFIAFVFMKMITCDRFIEGLKICDDHNSCPKSQFCGNKDDPDEDSGYCYSCDEILKVIPLSSKMCQLTDDGENVIYNQHLIEKCPNLKDKLKGYNENWKNTLPVSTEYGYGICCIDDDCDDESKCRQNVYHGGSCEINCCYGPRDFLSAHKEFGGEGKDEMCKGKKPFERIMDSKQPNKKCSVSDHCSDKPSQIACDLDYESKKGRKFYDYLFGIFWDGADDEKAVQNVLHEIEDKMGIIVEYGGEEKRSIYEVMNDILYERRPETAEQDLASFKTMYDNLDNLDEPTETPMPTLQN